MANSIIVQSRSSKFFTPSASTNGQRSRSTISSSIIPPTMPIGDQFQSSPDDCTRSFESVNQILRLALGLWPKGAKSTETCRSVGNESDSAVALVEPRASFTLHQQTFAATIKSSHSGQCCRHQIAFGFLEKIRRWADRDRSPQTQR